jgi:hypothetical protein
VDDLWRALLARVDDAQGKRTSRYAQMIQALLAKAAAGDLVATKMVLDRIGGLPTPALPDLGDGRFTITWQLSTPAAGEVADVVDVTPVTPAQERDGGESMLVAPQQPATPGGPAPAKSTGGGEA